MICPKCGSEQPDALECARCGVLVHQYQGPALGASAFRPSASPPPAISDATVTVPHPPPFTGGPVPEVMSLPPGAFKGTFGVGELLAETFSIYAANFVPFALLTALAIAPIYVLETIMIAAKAPGFSAARVAASILLLVVALIAPQIATAAITFGVYQHLRGRETSMAECLRRGVSLLMPVLRLVIVQGLAIGAGILVCIVPGVLMALRWAVSIPAAVTEGTGVGASIERSTFLTEGLRTDIFGVLFVLGALEIGLMLLVRFVAAKNPFLHLALSGLKDLLVVGLSATASAVLYYRLRGIKESVDVDQIASVFA
jgi:hypothetical protein